MPVSPNQLYDACERLNARIQALEARVARLENPPNVTMTITKLDEHGKPISRVKRDFYQDATIGQWPPKDVKPLKGGKQ